MSLIKKTIILAKDSAKGYITLIRLGNTAGAKVVLNAAPKGRLWLALKLGKEQYIFPIKDIQSEFELNNLFDANDAAGAVIIDNALNTYALGGVKEIVNIYKLREYVQKELLPKEIVVPIIEIENDIKVTEHPIEDTESEQIEEIAEPAAAEDTEILNTEAFAETEPIFEENTETESVFEADTEIEKTEEIEAITEVETVIETEERDIFEESVSEAVTENSDGSVAEETAEVMEIRTEECEASCPIDGENVDKEAETRQETEVEIESYVVEEDIMTNAYEKAKEAIKNQKETENPFSAPKDGNFFQSVRGRLEEILTINPREEALEKIIPDSKWVRVKYDAEDYYVVGVLTENSNTTHIAYGVPGKFNIKPPKDIADVCDFIPVQNAKGDGYWLMFQDVKDGSILKN